MTLHNLVQIDKAFSPLWHCCWFVFRGFRKLFPSGRERQGVVIIKLLGVGSITRITNVLEDNEVDRSLVTLCTFKENQKLCEVLGYNQVHYLRKGLFSLPIDCLRFFMFVIKNRPNYLIDYERCANLVGLFRLAAATLSGAGTIGFHRGSRNQTNGKDMLFAVGHNSVQALIEKTMPFCRRGLATTRVVDFRPDPSKVLVNINASNYLSARRYPAKHYIEAIKEIGGSNSGLKFYFTGTKSERSYVESVTGSLRSAGIEAHNRAGNWDLSELVCEMASSAIVVTNDSGPFHLAAYLGVPTVAIWGPTHFKQFGYADTGNIRNVTLGLPCSPCFIHPKSKAATTCNGEISCMVDMQPKLVASAAGELLATIETNRALRWPLGMPLPQPIAEEEVAYD